MNNRKWILKAAELAHLDLTEDEIIQYTQQLGRILEHFSRIDSVETEEIEPAVHALDLLGPLRKDTETESHARHEMMSNTEHESDGFYSVRKIIE